MDLPANTVIVLIYGYLIGSVPSAYIIGRLTKGIDLRRVGSGNVGGANVWVSVGKIWAFPAGIFDVFIKGLTPTFVARSLDQELAIQVIASLLAIAGHNWPIWLKLQGGRGVAPTAGVLLALGRLELAVLIVLATSGWQLTKASGLWVLMGFCAMPLLVVWLGRPTEIFWLTSGILTITIIKRLASNTLGSSATSIPKLIVNRILFDRDIANHDAWVRRNV